MNTYDLQAVSSLVSDDGQPDFIIGNTINIDIDTLLLGIFIGFVLGVISCLLYKWADKKYKQYMEDDTENNNKE